MNKDILRLIMRDVNWGTIYYSMPLVCRFWHSVCSDFILGARSRNLPPKINMRWIIEFHKFIKPDRFIKKGHKNCSLKSLLYFSREGFRKLDLHEQLIYELDFVLYKEIDWEYVHHKGEWNYRDMYFIKRPERKKWIKNYQY